MDENRIQLYVVYKGHTLNSKTQQVGSKRVKKISIWLTYPKSKRVELPSASAGSEISNDVVKTQSYLVKHCSVSVQPPLVAPQKLQV